MLLERMTHEGFEKVVFCTDPDSGLRAIVAIHSTVLGPAGGGVRMYPYASEEEALNDVMRLARGMTYKNAAAGLALGGGKSVIIGDPTSESKEKIIRAMGRKIQSLRGEYLAGFDIGTTLNDMEILLEETDFVLTRPQRIGGGGDVSGGTALGVVEAMRAAIEHEGFEDFNNLKVAVQGLGAVGAKVAQMLVERGATVIATDVRPQMAEFASSIGAKWVDAEDILSQDVDVFCPCARGGIIDDFAIATLKARIVVGAANNILLEPSHGPALDARGITYVPDFIANAGGIICDADSRQEGGFNLERAEQSVRGIYGRVHECLKRAKATGTTAQDVAHAMAEERLTKHP
ncbi:leucine dehydrogenase [Arthrobacter sp. 1088]|uniref:Leu/Phe/Val dehydrogenase n=1 Tax=Arthrobacter sp. 1088 TaxID=2817768 RepID=UPI002861EFC9|nr:Glu/Leu/Phe/Val dehydrogenase dimerization domain-containing protein [Arthrobacter sp. 1088]MDR6688652.1 leucine dehydrogenase [Arthrobacter sp. 1088]